MRRPIVSGEEGGAQAVIIQKESTQTEQARFHIRQRKHQHLLDVKVRAKNVAARRTQNVLLTYVRSYPDCFRARRGRFWSESEC